MGRKLKAARNIKGWKKKNRLAEALNVKLVRSHFERWNGRLDLNSVNGYIIKHPIAARYPLIIT